MGGWDEVPTRFCLPNRQKYIPFDGTFVTVSTAFSQVNS